MQKCGKPGQIPRKCANLVDALFGEEEQWTAENTEENAVAMEIENAATM